MHRSLRNSLRNFQPPTSHFQLAPSCLRALRGANRCKKCRKNLRNPLKIREISHKQSLKSLTYMKGFRNFPPRFKRELTADQCAQIDAWIREQKLTEPQIIDKVKAEFDYHHLSRPALNRYSGKLRLQDCIEARRRQTEPSPDPADHVPDDLLAAIQKNAMESLENDATKWTPGRLLKLQHLALEAWRRQITENGDRRADELKAIAAMNAQIKKDAGAWRKQYALIKAALRQGQKPDPSWWTGNPPTLQTG